MKTLCVGRHPTDLPVDFEVVEVLNVTFVPQHSIKQVKDILETARVLKCEAILFQNIPGVLMEGLFYLYDTVYEQFFWGERSRVMFKIGVIVSVPGNRLPPETITCPYHEGLEEVVKFLNPNAEIKIADGQITVTASRGNKFQFSHIEWIDKAKEAVEKYLADGDDDGDDDDE